MQLKPSEFRCHKKAPETACNVDIVLFLGCAAHAVPHTIFALLDLLERMGINFVALGGIELCCGYMYVLQDIEEAETTARELVNNIEVFSPKKVLLYSPLCYISCILSF